MCIAARLFVTERTVEAHVTKIFQKLRLAESPDQHRRVLAVLRVHAVHGMHTVHSVGIPRSWDVDAPSD
jgi:DNA-binding NarL/FixJ family response regulator